MFKNKKIAIAIATISLCSIVFFASNHSKTFKSPWGEEYAISAEIHDILSSSPIINRLKDIDQSGPPRYFGPLLPSFSRYDHSLGVWHLLKKTGATFKEQIAGLFHDSSHSVFSHVADFLFAKNIDDHTQDSYQDTIHINFLKKNNIANLTKILGLDIDDLDPEKKEYSRLNQPLPDMCADRIQYNLHTGVLLHLLSNEEAKAIFDDINFKDGKWFFTNPKLAKKFAEVSIYFTQNFWGAKWNVSMNIHFAKALSRAIALKLIDEEEIFSTDEKILKKLLNSSDTIIQANLEQCKNPMTKNPSKVYNSIFFAPKFRGVDPLIENQKTKKLVRLSEIDTIFQYYYNTTKEYCARGFFIDVLNNPEGDLLCMQNKNIAKP